MDFIVRLEDGSQQGPLDQETLRKWVDIDKVKRETPVRNALLQNWKEAGDFDFLAAALEAQDLRAQAQAKEKKGFFSKILGGDDEKPKDKRPKEVSSAFKYEYIPKPAGVGLRLGAAAFDWALIAIFALILLSGGICQSYLHARSVTTPAQAQPAASKAPASPDAAAPKPVDSASEARPPSAADSSEKGYHPGSIWTDTAADVVYACVSSSSDGALWCEREYLNSLFIRLFAVFCFGTMLYLGFSLGFFSQTIGMWFWGIFLAKSADGAAVFPLRAFAFAILSLPLGFLMPAVSFVMPDKRSVHDMLAGVKLIGIAAKPKS